MNTHTLQTVFQPDPTWINYTQAGNQQMQRCQPESAQVSYQKALNLAEQVMRQQLSQCQEANIIYLYVVSCTNFASSLQALDNWLEAETTLLKVHSTTSAIMNDENLALSVRQTAYHGMRRAFMHLANFYDQTQQTDALAEILLQSRMQGQQFMTHLIKDLS
ncbi:MAG: hypothetical protein AAGC54_08795 [Cyanobacteria bacterium P01_F01_bin.4]